MRLNGGALMTGAVPLLSDQEVTRGADSDSVHFPIWMLPLLRCPQCHADSLETHTEGLECRICHSSYPLRGGILSMVRPEQEAFFAAQRRSWQVLEQLR